MNFPIQLTERLALRVGRDLGSPRTNAILVSPAKRVAGLMVVYVDQASRGSCHAMEGESR